MGLLSLGKVQLPTRGGFSFATVKYPTLGELQSSWPLTTTCKTSVCGRRSTKSPALSRGCADCDSVAFLGENRKRGFAKHREASQKAVKVYWFSENWKFTFGTIG
jgi:hypothetical protein